MKNDEKVVAEVIRIDYDENNDDVFLIFKIKDPQFKKKIKENWLKDIELKLINKQLIEE